jgi:hypothetical protein
MAITYFKFRTLAQVLLKLNNTILQATTNLQEKPPSIAILSHKFITKINRTGMHAVMRLRQPEPPLY